MQPIQAYNPWSVNWNPQWQSWYGPYSQNWFNPQGQLYTYQLNTSDQQCMKRCYDDYKNSNLMYTQCVRQCTQMDESRLNTEELYPSHSTDYSFIQLNRFLLPQTWGYYGFSSYKSGPWHQLSPHQTHYHMYYLNPALIKPFVPHQPIYPYQGFPFTNGN
ncbi:hypothetical protein [Bacillus sp. CGMCC 1.16541]|uniref:hypothetical protein n=1 Tax=Bacillus sp. CGMCC 1.16541 TaxID=2185143 RepID=UPI0013A55511|nr:hypothetical protein [Bacillus sp. CGMCC 1.16541]